MTKKLYVGNLPYSTTDEILAGLFSEIGTVDSAVVIKDRDTGRSKGFGFVEMSTDDEANQAIEKFDGSDVEGRALRVNPAKPKAPRSDFRPRD